MSIQGIAHEAIGALKPRLLADEGTRTPSCNAYGAGTASSYCPGRPWLWKDRPAHDVRSPIPQPVSRGLRVHVRIRATVASGVVRDRMALPLRDRALLVIDDAP